MKDQAIVEAALYSAGRALSVDELSQVTGFDSGKVKEHLRKLAKDYDARGSALEVAPIGTKWTMQIRSEYTDRARAFAPPELARDLLKTVALVAYHQPLLQSDLFDMIGEKVYEHTKSLEGLGLINRKPAGHSFTLTTTRHFAEFFGLKATDREGIRKLMAQKAGVTYKEKAKDEPEPAAPAPPAETPPEAPAGPAVPLTG